jgi:hypothetical protein
VGDAVNAASGAVTSALGGLLGAAVDLAVEEGLSALGVDLTPLEQDVIEFAIDLIAFILI